MLKSLIALSITSCARFSEPICEIRICKVPKGSLPPSDFSAGGLEDITTGTQWGGSGGGEQDLGSRAKDL